MKFNPFKSDVYCLAIIAILLTGEVKLNEII